MADKPKQPAIPAVPNDVSPSMRNFMTAIREVLQVQAGQGRGSELDKAVTFRDLGLTTGMGSSTAMMGRVLNNLVQNGELVTQQAVERPTTPTGVTVSAYIGGIAIAWDNPRYSGHAYTEVFAQPTPVNAQEQPVNGPALNTETMLLGTAASPLLGVQARTLLGYYIWVRHVNTLGQVGPVHAALGSYVYLPPSPSYLLEQLTNEVTRDQLSIELQEPIDLVPVLQTSLNTEITNRTSVTNTMASSITSVSAVANAKNKTYLQASAPTSGMAAGDMWVDSDDNNKLYRYSGSAWVLAADARIASNAAAITAEQTARADADTALSTSINTVSAVANAKNKTYYQTAAPSSGMTTGDLWVDSNDNNKMYRYSGSAWVLAADARIATNAAAIIAEQTARANAVGALASDITTVQAYVNGDMTNLFLNPNFVAGQPHGFNDQTLTTAVSDPAGTCPNERYCVVRKRDNTGKRIAVTPGDVYSLSMYCCALSASAPPIGIGLFITDRDGVGIAWQLAATRPAGSTSWGKISGDLTIPANAAFAQFWVHLSYSPGTYYDWAITGLTWVNGNATKALSASVQTNATAIANLDGTYTAQWSAKTQVGDLVGGFGTFNDGTTTRFTVHANRFAIMDSSLGNQRFVPFVVDNGRTVISDAFIRNAYIEQLAARQITAAKINSLTLNAVNITGGTLSLGSGNNMSFQEGGSAGFGKGGPYGGWGYGWNTIIYDNGNICTNNLTASGGSFTGTVNANAGTFNNVTINSNCDVKGTIYADKIVGDVVAIKPVNFSFSSYRLNEGATVDLFSFSLSASNIDRYIKIAGSSCSQGSSGNGVYMRILVDGVLVKSEYNSVDGLHFVPAKNWGQTKILFQAYHNGGAYDYTYVAARLIGEVTVYPKSSGTFV